MAKALGIFLLPIILSVLAVADRAASGGELSSGSWVGLVGGGAGGGG
jgi:hypothetical protein